MTLRRGKDRFLSRERFQPSGGGDVPVPAHNLFISCNSRANPPSLHPRAARDTMPPMSLPDRDFRRLIKEKTGRPPETGVELREFSNFRIGGPADFFFRAASLDEIRAAAVSAREAGIRYYVIGGGFNLLFDDSGFRGLIIQNSCRGLKYHPETFRLTALSGTPISDLSALCREHGLEGLEFMTGIPGTVGGAVCGNAGAFGRSIGEILEEALLMDPSGVERPGVPAGYFEFSYRHSRLKTSREIVLEAALRLNPGIREDVAACMDAYLALREERHPSRGTAYAGSFFKNPAAQDGSRVSAGKLLEEVGAKELVVGGAGVHSRHGNFIYNRGGATAGDIRALAAILKSRVKDRFGVDLEEEVIFLPAAPASV